MIDSKETFVNCLVDCCQKGTFATSKHDPSRLSVPWKDQRSITQWDNTEMEKYLCAREFRVLVYKDINPKHTPELYVIIPKDPSVVTGSGVPALSTTPTTQCDIFAVPSGTHQGWHAFADQLVELKKKESSGSLTLLKELM